MVILVACLIGLGASSAVASPAITEFASGNGPLEATQGPDGNLWFVESAANKIGRLTPAGVLTEFSSGLPNNCGLVGITAGPDGNLWFTEAFANRIGRISPTGTITQFSSGISGGSSPHDIVAGPDGRLWFTETAGNRIGRITTAGSVTEFSTGISANSNPWAIAAGLDGNLWFTEHVPRGGVARITTGGVVSEFGSSGYPSGITAGPDGNIWFAENASPGHIARITPSGTLTEFSAGLTNDGGPQDIAAGDDGNLYFAESNGSGELGQITPSGTITEFTTGLSTAPYSVTPSGDGNMWFTENSSSRVGRLTLAPGTLTNAPLATSATAATLAGSVSPNSQATLYHFEWGTTTAYGSSTTPTSAGAGASSLATSANISGLTGSTTYHYRIVATNGSGTTDGQDAVFTAQTMPVVTTEAASPVAQASATLNATVDPDSLATTYHFEWGQTTSYGTLVPALDAAVGSDSTDHLVSQLVLGLNPGSTYHYRVVATSSGGTSYGVDSTFTTPLPAPSSTTGAATAIDETDATLNGTVNPSGSPTTYHFDLGLTTDYGVQWPSSDAAVASTPGVLALTQPLSALTPGTTYHYRLVVTNAFGIGYGQDQVFTTPATSPAPPAGGTPAPPTPASPNVGPQLPPATRPSFGRTATIATLSGDVLVKLPGRDTYTPLVSSSTVPVGSTIDTTDGSIRLTDIRDRGGKPQTATFRGGAFKVTQARSKGSSTVLALTAPIRCVRSTQRVTASTPRRATKRQLWGHDNHGRFVTRGRSAVATVRGTSWFMLDSCAGTLVRVSRGAVSVRDLVRRRTVLVSAGHSYLAHKR
jgi:streptogramin lyase